MAGARLEGPTAEQKDTYYCETRRAIPPMANPWPDEGQSNPFDEGVAALPKTRNGYQPTLAAQPTTHFVPRHSPAVVQHTWLCCNGRPARFLGPASKSKTPD